MGMDNDVRPIDGMSPEQARQRADEIVAQLARENDPEQWHAKADSLVRDVLAAIVAADPDPWVRMMAEQGPPGGRRAGRALVCLT